MLLLLLPRITTEELLLLSQVLKSTLNCIKIKNLTSGLCVLYSSVDEMGREIIRTAKEIVVRRTRQPEPSLNDKIDNLEKRIIDLTLVIEQIQSKLI